MKQLQRVLLSFSFIIFTINAHAQITALDGNWYSHQWKYGYVLKDGVGIATSTNSPNFQIGQNILQLKATSTTTFTGQQVYTDGKFYKVNARLQNDGRLYFEGEKNAKWVMDRLGTPPRAASSANQTTQTNSSTPTAAKVSPSFDCSKASSPHEKAVCANPTLSSLDNQLAKAYKNARAKSADPEALRKTQIDWIKATRGCVSDSSCIEKAYKDRIVALEGVSNPIQTTQMVVPVTQKTEVPKQSSLHYIAEIDSGIFFVDKTSIKRNGDWVSYTYVTDYLPKINFQNQDVLSQVAFNKINCSSKQLIMGDYNLYSQKKGAGTLVASAQLGVNAPPIPAQTIDNPNSVNAAVFNYVCQPPPLQSTVTHESNSSEKAETHNAELKTTATSIIEEFNSNKLSATLKYKGKTVLIEGLANNIEPTTFRKPASVEITLKGSDLSFESVRIILESNEHQTALATKLSKGDYVRAVCKKVGSGAMMGVLAEECLLLEQRVTVPSDLIDASLISIGFESASRRSIESKYVGKRVQAKMFITTFENRSGSRRMKDENSAFFCDVFPADLPSFPTKRGAYIVEGTFIVERDAPGLTRCRYIRTQ